MTDWPAPGWAVHVAGAHLRIRVVREMPALAADIEREIDALWQSALRRTDGRLFNGRVFSADDITPDLVSGHWTEFRRIVAQMERPDIYESLRVRPLAVNGITNGPDGVVMGRRPGNAVYQAGMWQIPPAGSIDDGAARADGVVDFAGQVLVELAEELGIGADAVRVGRPLALVEHADSHVIDLGVEVTTMLSGPEIRAAHARAGNAEYAAVEIVSRAGLADFVRDAGATMVPQARVFLTELGWLPRI